MARLFALIVIRIRILLAANNTQLESAEDEEREAECLSFFSTLDMASILELNLYYNIFNCNFFCGVSLNELKNLFADIYCWNKWFY